AVSRAVDVLALVRAGLADELAVLEFAGLAVLADLPGDRAAVAGSILGVADVVPGAVHALAGILDADAVVAALVVRADLAAALAVSVGGIAGLAFRTDQARTGVGDGAAILPADLTLGAGRGAALADAVGRVTGLVLLADHTDAAVLRAAGASIAGDLADLVRLADDPGIVRTALADAVGGVAGRGGVEAPDLLTEVRLLRLVFAARHAESRSEGAQ